MTTTIDRAGSVVIPKDNGVVEISPTPPRGKVIEREGFLLWEAAEPLRGDAVLDAIQLAREERTEELLRRSGLEDRPGH